MNPMATFLDPSVVSLYVYLMKHAVEREMT